VRARIINESPGINWRATAAAHVTDSYCLLFAQRLLNYFYMLKYALYSYQISAAILDRENIEDE
jgi:hypothetical protein